MTKSQGIKKTPLWFAVVTTIFILLIAVNAALGQATVAVILAIAAVTYYLVIFNPPSLKTSVTASTNSIIIGKKPIPYHSLRWFRIFIEPEGLKLELQPLSRFKLPIGVEIDDRNLKKLINHLTREVPVNLQISETFSDKIGRFLGI